MLAPAGSKESFYAAIAYGANAVYLGIDAFNARMGAENIGLDELPEFVDFAHQRNVRVYITLNTLIRDDEWTKLEQVVEELVRAGIDAVILQDLGVLTYIQATYPELECHASTQFSVYDVEGVQRAKELGFSRVVIARETPVDEIARCTQVEGIELEVFVHGALCVSASGQCLFSSLRGGRSGNRGRCAQPCRLNYACMEAKGNEAPWLSLKDLCSIGDLDRLIEIGVHSLKIEGRSKRPAYVAGVVRSYREAIDGDTAESEQRLDEMKRLFYRGFTRGLLHGEPITEIGSLGQPNHQGVQIGKMLRFEKGKALVHSRHPIVSGDGIRYRDESDGWIGQNVSWVQKNGPDRYWLRLKNTPMAGSEVFLTKDHALERSFIWTKIPVVPWIRLEGHCAITVGQKLHLVVTMDKQTMSLESETVIEAAKTRGSLEDEVKKHFMKLGNTPFEWASLTVKVDENAYVPARTINEIRRKMVERLWAVHSSRLPIREPAKLPKEDRVKKPIRFSLAVYGPGIGQQVDLSLYKQIWILPELEEEAWVKKARAEGIEIGWTSLYGQKYPIAKQQKEMNDWNQSERDQAFCGPGLFPMNRWTIARLGKMGGHQIHLSPELSMDQIRTLAESTSADLEVVGYGRIPLMTMRHCPMKASGTCPGGRCDACRRVYHLKDGEDRVYPIVRKGAFGYLLSDQPLVALAEAQELEDIGISSMRIQFWEAEEPIEEVQSWIRKWNQNGYENKQENEKWLYQNGIKGDRRLMQRGVL